MDPQYSEFEKLGVFYLGRQRLSEDLSAAGDLLLYDSKDLTTHAVVVGMTGSGKTGLCIDLLEEAALDRIPAIAVDPKGDISNLLLTFPNLSADEFLPWVDAGQAARQGQTKEQFAAEEAERWRKGLARWGQNVDRIKALRDSTEFRVYTPGSNAARPLSLLKSFAAPDAAALADDDLLRERIASTASGLLTLLGYEADPIRSREHILMSMILEHAWRAGRDLDLAGLISEIQNPPFQRVGVMELDAFFPPKDRSALALTINNLLASPSFSSWLSGEALSIKNMLHTPQGKPCISILSIAHLSDAERMFFVTFLLEELLAWVRRQSGTSSLRAIFYMDEVFGYFPPTAKPPSKQPMLTLLKQARAYGLGIVLATQNPVDLDYKGLSNTGTWFLGRLQTERDKARVLEGLEGAAAATGSAFNRSGMDTILAGLGSRVFLMNNVHDSQPVVFETRWAMSYLPGPLTRQQLQQLAGPPEAPATRASEAASPPQPVDRPITTGAPPSTPLEAFADAGTDPRQLVPVGVPQRYAASTVNAPHEARMVWYPAVMARARVHYVKSPIDLDHWDEIVLISRPAADEDAADLWSQADISSESPELQDQPPPDVAWGPLPPSMQRSKSFEGWRRGLTDFLYRTRHLQLFECRELKLVSQPGESEGDFRVRLEMAASERRDLETEKLRQKFASKLQTLRDRRQRAEARVEREKAQVKQHRLSSVLSAGQSLLGALLGRRKITATSIGRATSSVKALGRASDKQGDVDRAEESLEQVDAQIEALQSEFHDDVEQLTRKLRVAGLELTSTEVAPRRADIDVADFCLIWLPYRVDSAGAAQPAFAR